MEPGQLGVILDPVSKTLPSGSANTKRLLARSAWAESSTRSLSTIYSSRFHLGTVISRRDIKIPDCRSYGFRPRCHRFIYPERECASYIRTRRKRIPRRQSPDSPTMCPGSRRRSWASPDRRIPARLSPPEIEQGFPRPVYGSNFRFDRSEGAFLDTLSLDKCTRIPPLACTPGHHRRFRRTRRIG